MTKYEYRWKNRQTSRNQAGLLKSTVQFRPLALARYMALSAAAQHFLKVNTVLLNAATPTDMVTDYLLVFHNYPAFLQRNPPAFSQLSRKRRIQSGSTTRNSSPPCRKHIITFPGLAGENFCEFLKHKITRFVAMHIIYQLKVIKVHHHKTDRVGFPHGP